ncbi:MAG TPA: hypothetical protein VIQ01_02955 [Burkholderiales bacterium]
MDRRTFLMSASALAVAGCATAPRGVYEITEIPAPTYHVGDRWTYRRTDGYNSLPRGILTRAVTAVDPSGIRIVTQDENGRVIDDARYKAPGLQLAGTFSEDGPMIGRCATPFREYDFPLVAGKRWRDAFYLDRDDLGGTRNYVTATLYAEGWEDIHVADGNFHALVLRRLLNLGEKSFWYGTMYRYETEWYVPALRSFARMQTVEEYYDRSGGGNGGSGGGRGGGGGIRNGDRFIYELQSFQLA